MSWTHQHESYFPYIRCQLIGTFFLSQEKDKANPALEEIFFRHHGDNVLELYEMYSYTLRKIDNYWILIAICGMTRQVVAFMLGDRIEASCRMLWERIPAPYKKCKIFSSFLRSYCKVFPKQTHCSVGKETGPPCHVKRWNNICRQKNARYTRKTLSFSKTIFYQKLVTRLFIVRYNLNLKASLVN